MEENFVIANGQRIAAAMPCSIEEFLVAQDLLPRSVVVEHNGLAVAPSEFAGRRLSSRDSPGEHPRGIGRRLIFSFRV